MKGRPGVDQHKPDRQVCMVVGCARVAIYRNANSARGKSASGGYCDRHKSFAVSSQVSGDWVQFKYERPWVPLCSDSDDQ